MILPLGHQQAVPLQILPDHEPAAPVAPAADSQAPALAQGIIHQPVMPPDHLAVRGHHVPGLGRQVVREELFKIPLPDEADPGGILLMADRKPPGLRQGAHLRLGHAAHRKHGFQQLLPVHHIEKIALILIGIRPAKQAALPVRPHEMARRHLFRAQAHGKIQEGPELDLPVAQHVRVRRPPRPVFLQEIGKNPVPVFPGKIHAVIGNADDVADVPHIPPVVLRGADAVFILLFPVFHKDADHVIALLLQKQGRHGGVHASAHSDDDSFLQRSASSSRLSTSRTSSSETASRLRSASTVTNRSGSRRISSRYAASVLA